MKFKTWFTLSLISLVLAACQSSAPQKTEAAPSPLLASGKIDMDPELRSQADPLAVIFLIARSREGQIVAVQKLYPPFRFPVAFQLKEEDRMVAGRNAPEEFSLSARLDKDGNANPATSGDILGKAKSEWIRKGSSDVEIQLNQAMP